MSERRTYRRKGINIHRLGEAFVGEVTEMRRVEARGSGETEVGEELEFLARVRGWNEEEHSERTGELLAIEKDTALCRSVVKKGCILHIPGSHYPRETPKYRVKTGWWYTPAEEVRCKRCKGCDEVQAQDAFNLDEWQKVTGSRCRKCRCIRSILKRRAPRPKVEVERDQGKTGQTTTVGNREIGTGISEASKRVPIFPFDTQGGKRASSYFRQRNWVQAREAQIRFPAG